MSQKLGICGSSNTGKSYSRRTIRDGENVIILQPSVKAPHLFTGPEDARKPLGPFNIISPGGTLQDVVTKLQAPSVHHVIDYWNKEKKPGFLKKEYLKGNIQLVKDIANLPIWLSFIDKHMPWIHTVIISDFTHFISEVISRPEFVNRRIGNEAFQKFTELAGEALRNFILNLDEYRHDLIVVTEYHAVFDELQLNWQMYTPSGKMLVDKFQPPTYYDVFLFTDATIKEDDRGNVTSKEYNFITERTSKFPLARAMNMFNTTRIPNDLQLVLDKTREYLGIELPK